MEAHRPPAAGHARRCAARGGWSISSSRTVENYEYGFFWYLYQDGNIQFEIKLTGILSLGALQPGEKPPYGALIAPQLYAPNHQHFFNVRLDFDLDGAANIGPAGRRDARRARRRTTRTRTPSAAKATLLEDREAGPGAPEPRNGPHLEDRQPARAERGRRAGRLQVPAGRQLRSRSPSPNAWWRKRAGFVNHHVWVTPFAEDEKYAAGDYPNQSTRRRRAGEVDRAGPADREHRRGALVHLRAHPHPAAGGLPGDADRVHRLSAQADRVLRP